MSKDTETAVFIGGGTEDRFLQLALANRHGLVTGATGTGKTVTLQVIAEALSRSGVPVFAADIKGDLSGISQPGEPKPKLVERATELGLGDMAMAASPTILWDVFGKDGHPVHATISELGPLLLSRLMQLTEAQEGVLNIAFRVADEEGLLILDLKDLQSLLSHIAERADELTTQYGNVSKASVGAIQRRLLTLEQQGAEHFFAEPVLALDDIMSKDAQGRGTVSLLAADELMNSPRLYGVFLLWLMSELFEQLPEVGDLDRPKLVLFFDEAHLLFDEAPAALVDKIEQVVRLIRSKGVGVYFVTQNPLDVPESVLGQLGNRVQHALRAFTPKDQKAVRSAAETFRPNPAFDTADVITQLGVGEALVSTLDPDGTPNVVERVKIRPPCSRIGPATPEERAALIKDSPVAGRYDKEVDRESAYEILKERAAAATEAAAAPAKQASAPPTFEPWPTAGDAVPLPTGSPQARSRPAQAPARRSSGGGSQRQTVAEAALKSVVRSFGSTLGRELVRGVLGSFLRRR
ncbi:helicase HerA-like C-terminal domain-containing protein [Marinivivus vitaminiproducens]|uniref:helicase HerA-like C-terminal domain-containing protein n=1 Tax=Marinivivus vitaminiproducens TaxID=3035935 RepID=UPI0027A2AD06|nr:DUF853 domain-containing protein [Geminicoccaceae bacterium SCSIO 64248]